ALPHLGRPIEDDRLELRGLDRLDESRLLLRRVFVILLVVSDRGALQAREPGPQLPAEAIAKRTDGDEAEDGLREELGDDRCLERPRGDENRVAGLPGSGEMGRRAG